MKILLRFTQIILGLILFFALFTRTVDERGESPLLISQYVRPVFLRALVFVLLLLLSIRLVYGKLIHDGEDSSLILKGYSKFRDYLGGGIRSK